MKTLLNYKSLIKVTFITIVVSLMASQITETHAKNPNLPEAQEKTPWHTEEVLEAVDPATWNVSDTRTIEVPDGKRLEIKSITYEVLDNSGLNSVNRFLLRLTTFLGGEVQGVNHTQAMMDFGSTTFFGKSQNLTLFSDDDMTLEMFLQLNSTRTSNNPTIALTMTGCLVDLPIP